MSGIRRSFLILMFLGAVSVTLTGCDKSKLIYSWTDPDAPGYRFSKLVAVAVINDDSLREIAEEAVARNITRVPAYPSYVVLHEGELNDVERAKKRLLGDGYDGAVVLRLLSIEDRQSIVAPPYPDYYYDYWDYFGRSWSVATYSPSYLREERIVRIETTIFSIKDNKLLWVGVSESKNPESVSSLVDEIAESIGKELRKKGVTQ